MEKSAIIKQKIGLKETLYSELRLNTKYHTTRATRDESPGRRAIDPTRLISKGFEGPPKVVICTALFAHCLSPWLPCQLNGFFYCTKKEGRSTRNNSYNSHHPTIATWDESPGRRAIDPPRLISKGFEGPPKVVILASITSKQLKAHRCLVGRMGFFVEKSKKYFFGKLISRASRKNVRLRKKCMRWAWG